MLLNLMDSSWIPQKQRKTKKTQKEQKTLPQDGTPHG